MICPHCQKTLPENYSAMWCLFCARDFVDQPLEVPKMNWQMFWLVLFTPALISLLAGFFEAGEIVVLSTFVGSVVAGISCGKKLAERRANGMEPSKLFVFVFSTGLVVLSFVLCFAGCMMPVLLKSNGQ